MSVDGYCMMIDFGAPESEEIVIGILVGLIVLAYVGFVFIKMTRVYSTISEEMNKAVQHYLIIVHLRCYNVFNSQNNFVWNLIRCKCLVR